jgi:hypothetical protein
MVVAISWLKPVAIIDPKVLTTTTDDHFGIPLAWLIQSVTCVQVVYLLALIVSVTNQCEPSVEFQLSDLRLSKLGPPELFSDHIMFWLDNCWQVDIERDYTCLLVRLPQVALEFPVECRFTCSRVSKQEEDHLITCQELVDLLHQWGSCTIACL